MLSQIVYDFEAAHQSGDLPRVQDFVPAEAADRTSIAAALVRVDLEYRRKRGLPLCVDDYLTPFPELADDTTLVLDLIEAEYRACQSRGEQPAVAAYTSRFPTLAARLAPRLAAVRATSPTTLPGSPVPVGLPAVPGYEVLAKLGEGGMGVVYKARDLALKRMVAVKMVRTRDRLGPEQLDRFGAEAEAIARLQHPHIVQIFASGQYENHPYFVLEYVAGGSLDRRLQGRPQPPRDAARLVMLLARAVHAAHQKGIVHRDLKPGNILLAPAADEPALNTLYGCPKLTDFGLAKYLDGDRDATATGALMGTAGYMAPEQAAGKVKQIGPATDVYGLGVILYELLTGRVPLLGETVLDTLEQIRTREPPPPRAVQPDVPAALEAICLKCLRKPIGDRYPSAAELADDLRRFLDGETVQAPPVPPRSWRLRPVLLATAGMAVLLAAVLLVVWLRNRTLEQGGWPDGKPAERRARLEGELIVRVYSEEDPAKAWLRVQDEGALPVRPNELMRIEAKLTEPGYAYLLLLDSQGRAVPLYPWNEEGLKIKDVAVPPPVRDAREVVYSPARANTGFFFDKVAGLETVLMLARRDPLPGDVSLVTLLGKLPQARLRNREEVAVLAFDRGAEDWSALLSQNRGVGDEVREIDNPLLRLMGRLREQFEVVRAVRFAHAGE